MHTHNRVPDRLSRWLRPVLTGVSIGVVCATLCLLLFALLIYKLPIPTAAVTPLAVAAMGLGGFVGGLAVGLGAKQRGLLAGAVCGTLLFLVLFIAGVARGDGVAWGYAAVKWAVLTVCSAAGGVLGVNRRRS